jgi:hypothetical protein
MLKNAFGGLSLESLETRETPSTLVLTRGINLNSVFTAKKLVLDSALVKTAVVTSFSGNPSVTFSSGTSGLLTSSSGTGSSSSYLSATSSVDQNGNASVYVTGGSTGNGSVFGTATATGNNGTVTQVFVG